MMEYCSKKQSKYTDSGGVSCKDLDFKIPSSDCGYVSMKHVCVNCSSWMVPVNICGSDYE